MNKQSKTVVKLVGAGAPGVGKLHVLLTPNMKTKKHSRAEREIHLRDVLGLKRVVRNGRVSWVRDETKTPKLQYTAAVKIR